MRPSNYAFYGRIVKANIEKIVKQGALIAVRGFNFVICGKWTTT